MLKISHRQFNALSDAREEAFARRVWAFRRRWFPDHQGSARVDLHEVGRLIESARGHGLTTELEIVHFVAAAACFGEDFDRYPPFRDLLGGRTDPADKAAFLAGAIQRAAPE